MGTHIGVSVQTGHKHSQTKRTPRVKHHDCAFEKGFGNLVGMKKSKERFEMSTRRSFLQTAACGALAAGMTRRGTAQEFSSSDTMTLRSVFAYQIRDIQLLLLALQTGESSH